MDVKLLGSMFILAFVVQASGIDSDTHRYKIDPAPDGHRCGLCPTYLQRVCAFNLETNSTFIFDNHCMMDLFNCMRGTDFYPMASYDHCLYFGNFAYVHGYKDREFKNFNYMNPDFA